MLCFDRASRRRAQLHCEPTPAPRTLLLPHRHCCAPVCHVNRQCSSADGHTAGTSDGRDGSCIPASRTHMPHWSTLMPRAAQQPNPHCSGASRRLLPPFQSASAGVGSRAVVGTGMAISCCRTILGESCQSAAAAMHGRREHDARRPTLLTLLLLFSSCYPSLREPPFGGFNVPSLNHTKSMHPSNLRVALVVTARAGRQVRSILAANLRERRESSCVLLAGWLAPLPKSSHIVGRACQS